MTVGRRQVVGWGALGLGAVALDGCGALLPWRKSPAMNADEVDRILAELDGVVGNLEALEPDVTKFGMKRGAEHVAQGTAICTRLLTALCTLGTLRDVPRDFWKEPRVEARLATAIPRIHASISTALGYLANIDDEEGARFDDRLKRDPDITTRILERVDEYARQARVPFEQRTYLRTATTQLSWRMRYEGTKDVTTKLAAKYQRAVGTTLAAFAIPADADDDAGGGDVDAGADADAGAEPDADLDAGASDAEAAAPAPAPLRARFTTSASPDRVRTAVCSLHPRATVDGQARQVLIDWEEYRCPTTSTVRLPDDAPPIRVAVHTEPGQGGETVVTITLYPPDHADQEQMMKGVTKLARELQRRVSPTTTVREPSVASRRGDEGESCRTKRDCMSPLECSDATCRAEDDEASSAKLMHTTKQLAKWGAYLSIPPICAIGALVLLCCLFMVIVAGCMYAAGD